VSKKVTFAGEAKELIGEQEILQRFKLCDNKNEIQKAKI